jgi:hypothetical protein
MIVQQSCKFEALFKEDSDLIFKPPCAIGLHIFFHATVTNFLLSGTPLQMKFLMFLSTSLINETGQE